MIRIYKAALGPLLMRQASQTWTSMLYLPEAKGPRTGVAGGERTAQPVRGLFVGDSTIAGVGVDTQDDALVSQSANYLHERIRRPVHWELVARKGISTRQALEMVAGTSLAPVDLLVISLGVNDVTTQSAPEQFISDYTELVDYLLRVVQPDGVIINGLPPFHILPDAPQPLRWYISQYGKRLDAALQRFVAQRDNFRYVSLQWATEPNELARDGYHPGPSQYRQWAQLVAQSAASVLNE